jgi:hypothetical protein
MIVMRRVCAAAVLGSIVLGAATPAAPARKPKIGVFGRVNGMKLKVVPKKKLPELIRGTFGVDPQAGGSALVLAVSEVPRIHGAIQVLAMTCLTTSTVLPWSADCIASYGEARFRRGDFDEKVWVADPTLDAAGVPVGTFHVTVESFDGTLVRGRFSGSLDSAQICAPLPTCTDTSDLGTVSGSGTFTLPVS